MMPNMNGHEALGCIRQIEEKHNISGLDCVKVIMTTALNDRKNIMVAFKEGCETYIVKPVIKDKLLAEMEKLGMKVLV
jgi:two-component system chemotaxis response regulator CheY